MKPRPDEGAHLVLDAWRSGTQYSYCNIYRISEPCSHLDESKVALAAPVHAGPARGVDVLFKMGIHNRFLGMANLS